MKKNLKLGKIIFIITIIFGTHILTGCTSLKGNFKDNYRSVSTESRNATDENSNNKEKSEILNYDEVKDSLIRFHVIANSDSDEDQKLKLKVRDEVIDYLYPYLSNSQSLDESRQIIKRNMDKVHEIAEQVIKQNNYSYSVATQLSRENFPEKSYGNIILPQGNYEAFRVIIGSGQGKNWWCVMFPPLCFVDESKAQVEYDKTEARIKANEKQADLKSELNIDGDDTNKVDDEENKENKVQVKFKILEIFNDLFN